MPDLIEPLPWDTDFFGMPIGRVDLEGADAARLRAIDAEARDTGVACLYGSLDPTDDDANRWAQLYGYRLVEVALTYERPPGPFTPRPSTSTVRRGSVDDLPALEPVIRTLAPWSRFGADPRFGPDAAYRMHRAWMERAAQETDDRALFIAEDDSGITGVATFVRTPVPRIDTKGVIKPGSGSADALMATFLDWAGDGPTQGGPCAARNLAPLRYVERCGFKICQTRYLFHWWLDETGSRHPRSCPRTPVHPEER